MDKSYCTELTASIFNWNHLLEDDNCKQIVLDSFKWLVNSKKCIINAFVIMPNHFHLLWKISDDFNRENVQGAFFSFTAHEFKKHFEAVNPVGLELYKVNKADRIFNFWQRDPMVNECWTQKFFNQKFEYTHNNPCQPHWNLVTVPEDYKWSSAAFYETGIKNFPWLTHFKEN